MRRDGTVLPLIIGRATGHAGCGNRHFCDGSHKAGNPGAKSLENKTFSTILELR
jgi:hypothetical protein